MPTLNFPNFPPIQGVGPIITEIPANVPTIASAATADDLLTALASVAQEDRSVALAACGVSILREAADLCGVGDADTLSKRQAIAAITDNF